MKNTSAFAFVHPSSRPWRLGVLLLATLTALAAQTTPACGGTVLVMTVENAAVAPGGLGSLDILLANDATATESANIGGFAIDLTVAAGSGISFTMADDATSTTYIFAGNSLGFLPTVTPTKVQANDFAAMDGTLLAPGGAPVALAHITFSADLGISPGMIPVGLIDYQAGTSLAKADGTKLEFTIKSGQITVTGLPEPSSMVMAATALLLGLVQTSLLARQRSATSSRRAKGSSKPGRSGVR
jgi:hypothetical protein